ncbi:hypothetical protein DU505_00615 [Billgrantia montanilacus]|uniref:Uncharacterized protein n=1 Tax=Billgrantia montanilacus TaxID=2282305 RepID=A0A368U3N1_9GAMM|nr:hypothetical protein DU505_00615 [Halomonas montanilacus]
MAKTNQNVTDEIAHRTSNSGAGGLHRSFGYALGTKVLRGRIVKIPWVTGDIFVDFHGGKAIT